MFIKLHLRKYYTDGLRIWSIYTMFIYVAGYLHAFDFTVYSHELMFSNSDIFDPRKKNNCFTGLTFSQREMRVIYPRYCFFSLSGRTSEADQDRVPAVLRGGNSAC